MSFHQITLDNHHRGRWSLGLSVLGTNPISKAPYRMVSSELKELKE
jgi:hypothetical protein